MKRKSMKKIVVFLLAVTLIQFSVLAAFAAADDDNPVIVTGAQLGDEEYPLVDAGADSGDTVAWTGTDGGEVPTYFFGDSNVDGAIDITDATNIQRVLVNLDELSFKGERLSDVDGSGKIDIFDATYIQRYLVGLECPDRIGETIAGRTMIFRSGYAQSFVEMNVMSSADYRNKDSDIIRFVVYVETDYDTDLDGKPDLVKAWVQIPRAAAEGDYKAPVIFEANPYSANANSISFGEGDEPIDEKLLMQTPPKRVPQGVASIKRVAEDFRYSDIEDFSSGDYTKYYYFLSRGFALVGSAGLGTRDSEGLELCGTAMEADAFKAIVEWIHGDRIAYSNRTDNLEVKADWSNGKTGMLGISYMGTLAYEVAATGVEGLEAIVPNAGISSWYDYTNRQGSPEYGFYEYAAFLSGICGSRFYDGIDDENAYNTYLGWRKYVNTAQKALRANYGEVWDVRDFSQSDKIKANALIIQGLNDENVRPKQFLLMMEAFERCGANAKAILHQAGHFSLGDNSWALKIGTYENYLWIVNRWFSYYLTGYDSGADRIPKYLIQSNVDGKFYQYDEWETGESYTFDFGDGSQFAIRQNGVGYWAQYIEEPTTIKGTVEVHLRLKADHLNFDKTAVRVSLIDISYDQFASYTGT